MLHAGIRAGVALSNTVPAAIQAGSSPRQSVGRPALGGLGGGEALLAGQAGDEGVEPLVLLAGVLREVVPLRRRHRVGREPGADGEDAGKAVLRDRIAGLGGALEPGGGCLLVLGDAGCR